MRTRVTPMVVYWMAPSGSAAEAWAFEHMTPLEMLALFLYRTWHKAGEA